MAKYTMELRRVCEIYGRDNVENWFKNYQLTDYLLPNQIKIINEANIWSQDRLARKIVDHYYMREIGLETPSLFMHYAKVKMNEIMEKWLPYIYTNSIEYNPLESVNFTITENRNIDGTANNSLNSSSNISNTNHGTSESNSSNTGSGLNIASDTPQGQINKQDILNGSYATSTNASETNTNIQDTTTTDSTSNADTTSNSTSTADSNTKETLTHTEIGNKGVMDSYQRQIQMFRDNIIAIDSKIIEELDTLFMGLY